MAHQLTLLKTAMSVELDDCTVRNVVGISGVARDEGLSKRIEVSTLHVRVLAAGTVEEKLVRVHRCTLVIPKDNILQETPY